jgi:hypothetical protein
MSKVAISDRRFVPPAGSGYVAAGLLLAHAALSLFWALGGTAGLGLLTEGLRQHAAAREPWFLAMLWGVAVLKTFTGLLAWLLAREFTFPVPQWMPLVVAWGAGIVLTFYGLSQIVFLSLGGLILNDGQELPAAFWPFLLLWAPLWLAIGVALLLTAWRSTIDAQRKTR